MSLRSSAPSGGVVPSSVSVDFLGAPAVATAVSLCLQSGACACAKPAPASHATAVSSNFVMLSSRMES
jgi:hypothetical protein